MDGRIMASGLYSDDEVHHDGVNHGIQESTGPLSRDQFNGHPHGRPSPSANTNTAPGVAQPSYTGGLTQAQFLPDNGPSSAALYASSGSLSSPRNHSNDPVSPPYQSIGSNSAARQGLLHSTGNFGPSPYPPMRTSQHTTAGAVPGNQTYRPGPFVRCSAPNCDGRVNRDVSKFLCEPCHQVLEQKNQRSVPDIARLNLGQGSSASRREDQATSATSQQVMAEDVRNSLPPGNFHGRGAAANPTTSNNRSLSTAQQAVPSGLRTAHQRPPQHQAPVFQHHSAPPAPPAGMGAQNPSSFHRTGGISLHTNPELSGQSASIQRPLSCHNYYHFEPGSIQNFNNFPAPSDNSSPKSPLSARASVPFPEHTGVNTVRARGAQSSPAPNGQSPYSANNPSPHVMYGQSLSPRNGPPLHPTQCSVTQWNDLSAPSVGMAASSHETKPFSQLPMQIPGQKNYPTTNIGTGVFRNPTPTGVPRSPSFTLVTGVPVATCHMPSCNQRGDPAYSGYCPPCYDWLQKNRKC